MRISDWSSDVCSSDLGGDDAELAEARQFGRVDDLRMFDAPAPVALVGFAQFLHRVQHFAVGRVANGVDRDLEIVHRRPAHDVAKLGGRDHRSEEHTSELQSLMRISYAVFCMKKKKDNTIRHILRTTQQNTKTN